MKEITNPVQGQRVPNSNLLPGYEGIDRWIADSKKIPPAPSSEELKKRISQITDAEFAKNPDMLRRCLDKGLIPADRVNGLFAFSEACKIQNLTKPDAFAAYATHPDLGTDLQGALAEKITIYQTMLTNTGNEIIDSISPKFEKFKAVLEDPLLSPELKSQFLQRIITSYSKYLGDPETQRSQMAVALIRAGAKTSQIGDFKGIAALKKNSQLLEACHQQGFIDDKEYYTFKKEVDGYLGRKAQEENRVEEAKKAEEAEPVQYMPPTRAVTPPLHTFEKQLAALKKSRDIPYEILEPYEALLRKTPGLVERLTTVKRVQNRFPEGFVEGLPLEIQKTLTEWFSKSKAERARALREIAKKRGDQVRAQTVMPSEIAKFLQSSGLQLQTSTGARVNIEDLSKALARKILDAIENPAKYQTGEYGIRLSENGELFRFPVFGADNKRIREQQIPLPVDLWVKPASDGNGIEFQIIGEKLAEGSYKTVRASTRLTVKLSESEHSKTIQRQALVTAKDKDKNIILNPLQEVIRVFSDEIKSGKVRFAGLLASTRRTNQQGYMEASDVRYSGDLNQRKDLTPEQKIQVLGDAAKTYLAMHQRGFVHGDVKPANIMIDEQSRGLVADFDWTSHVGKIKIDNDEQRNYLYWDRLRQNGYVTPFTDAYGLAKAAIESVFNIKVFDRRNISDSDLIKTLEELPSSEKDAIRSLIIAVLNANRAFDPKDLQITVPELQKKYPAFGEFLTLMSGYAHEGWVVS